MSPPKRLGSTFKADAMRLVAGSGFAQVITVFASPIISRLYTPDAYGVAALFTSIVGVISAIACMRYELSIVLPENDREAENLVALSLIISSAISLLAALLVFLTGLLEFKWTGISELAPYLWLIPISLFLNGALSALTYWATRGRKFNRISGSRISSTITSVSAALGAGFVGHATGGAKIVSNLAGQVVAVVVLASQFLIASGRAASFDRITLKEMLNGLSRYRRFPLYSSWSILINSASWQFPVWTLGFLFSPEAVGFYSLGFGFFFLPLSLITGSVGQVLLQRSSAAQTEKSLGLMVETLCERLLAISLGPVLILAVIGQDLFVIVFGRNWSEAGVYAQLLTPWILVWFIASPLSMIYIALEQQRKEMLCQAIIFLSRLVAVVIGYYLDSPRATMALFSVAGVFSYGYLIIVVVRISDAHVKNIMSRCANSIINSLFCFGTLIVFKACGIEGIGLIVAGVAFLFTYAILNKKTLLALLSR